MLGQTLSHYRITAALGAGGMGEVYRATDTNLGRDVAIKVLPPEVAQDAERLARFKREAHLLASLNHPNIAAIYGLEEADGKPFLALELVEGEDLKQRLARGAIPVDEALEIAKQIAEALEEAHDKGIVHRDLKPANVKLTPDGKVKVLDFGLAKAWAGDAADGSSSSPALSHSPTLANTGTMAGVILGHRRLHVARAGARQAGGQAGGRVGLRGAAVGDADRPRALRRGHGDGRDRGGGDEGARPRRAAAGDAPRGAAPARALPAQGPAARGCPTSGPPGSSCRTCSPALRPRRRRRGAGLDGGDRKARRGRARERSAWAAVALASPGSRRSSSVASHRAPEPRPPAHFVLDTPENLTFWEYSPVAVSPDGRHVAFVACRADGEPADLDPLPGLARGPGAPGTYGAVGAPFWSPDSTSIAFATEGELRKLTLAGGTVQRICALPPTGFDGGPGARRARSSSRQGGPSASLYSVPEAGGEAKPLTTLDAVTG